MSESTPPIIYKIMYYFVYHINTIALYWREKPTLLVNENKEIDKSPMEITQWVGAMAQDGKIRWVMITKIIMGVIFNVQNSYSSTLSLPTEEIFLVNGPIGPWQIFQSSIFALSREKCCYFRFFRSGAERSRRCLYSCGAFEYTRLFADLYDFTLTMHHPTKIISYCSIGWLGIFTAKFSGEDVFD